MGFQTRSRVRERLRRGALAPGAVTLVLAASLASVPPAIAQNLWSGTTSTYETGANWFPPSAPIAPGQSAVFDTGPASTTVNVTSVSIAPNSWTFNSGAQSYTTTGGAVNFSLAGPLGGIIDNAGAAISIANNIGESVAGVQVQNLGGGTLTLSGANSYSGGTTVANGGTLQATNSSAVGSGTVTLDNGRFQAGASFLIFSNDFKISNNSAVDANGFAMFISGNISGPGALTVLDTFGGGGVVLTGTNTYTGGTTICLCGTLQLGFNAAMGSLVGDVTNEGTFRIFNANTSGITSITNDGSFGHGVTTFFNATSASSINITNNSGGSTLFFNNSTAANATIINNSSGGAVPFGLGFLDNSNAGNATIINNPGGFIAFGFPGRVDTASAGHANITNNAGSALGFFVFANAGNATITTLSAGAVAFSGNSTGGNAQFITNGSGFVDFSGSTGPNGDFRISAGSIAGSGTYIIGARNTLTVGSNNLSTEVSGAIEDGCGCGPGGALEKVGTGTLTLSGTNNTYTGSTLVSGGTLLVTGSIASSAGVVVDTGATLGGTGTVAATFLNGGATLAPGLPTALGTLTVNDLLGFCNCTFYNVKVTSGGSDLTQVVSTGGGPGGFAGLAGTVRVTSLNNSYKFNSPYTILTAQGGFGSTQFDSLLTPTGINGSLSYTTTDVNLTLLSALGQLPGLNVNQHNVANALDGAFNKVGNSGNLGAIFSGNTLQNLTQVSGEIATGTQQATFDAMNYFLGLLTDPFIDGRGGASSPGGGPTPFAEEGDSGIAYAAKRQNAARDAFARFPTKADVTRNNLLDPHWSVWGAAYGGGSSTDGNAALGSNASTARAFGFAAGADYKISPATLVGFALAGGGTNFSVNGFGTGRSDLFQAGAFVRHNVGAAYISAAAAYGWQNVTTDRTVTVAGIDQLHAQFNANAYSGRVEGGYRFATPWMGITPYAAGQFTTYSLPAYAESVLSGSNAFALNYSAKDVTASRTELGVRTDKSYPMQNGIFTLRGRLAWAHDFNTDRNITPVFQTLPGAAFVVNGASQAPDSVLTTASAEMKWLNGWSAAGTFEGQFSDITRSYAGKGVVRYTW